MEYDLKSLGIFGPSMLHPRFPPLLRSEIEALSAALETGSHDQSRHAELQLLRQTVTKHWNEIFGSFDAFAGYQYLLDRFVKSMVGLLINEYTPLKLPLSDLAMSDSILSFGDVSQRAEAATAMGAGDETQMDYIVNKTVGFSIRELCLVRNHVELRYRSACSGTSLAESLWGEGDRAGLEGIMTKDRHMLQQIVIFDDSADFRQARNVILEHMKRRFEPDPKGTTNPVSSPTSSSWTMSDIFGANKSQERNKNAAVDADADAQASEKSLSKLAASWSKKTS